MRRILSIIIPTYNMERYLNRCLDSLLSERASRLLEVLIVNDGSKDRSSLIAHEYADKYPDIFQVIDKSNGNYGSCINAALPLVTARFIKVLDSDDYFDIDVLDMLLERLQTCTTDAVLLDYTIIYPDKKQLSSFSYKDGQILNFQNECPEYFSMHSLIYNSDIFHRFCYHQSEGVSYTDQEWIFYPMFYVRNLQYIKLNLYQYIVGRVGQTMEENTIIRHISTIENLAVKMLSYIETVKTTISLPLKQYAENVLRQQLELIYRVELIYNCKADYNRKTLINLDKQIKSYDINFYKSFKNLTYTKIKYIEKFRKNYTRLPFIFCRIMILIHQIRVNRNK